MLQVQGISVEVGGRLVVENASFSVMPRDKVGIVGRNGAGKTSLFKVLGGAVEPHGGKILRLTMEESPSAQNIAKFSKAEDDFASKGVRVDEWNGLENRQGCKPLGGSNPPPSAM